MGFQVKRKNQNKKEVVFEKYLFFVEQISFFFISHVCVGGWGADMLTPLDETSVCCLFQDFW